MTILPAFAKRPLVEITAAEISTWYAGMRLTPTQQANAYGLLKSIFKEAVEERLVEVSPCRVKAGTQKERAREIEVLTVDSSTATWLPCPRRGGCPSCWPGGVVCDPARSAGFGCVT